MKKLIYTEENFISPHECQELIELSKSNPNEMPYGGESRGGDTYLTTIDGIYFESQKNNVVDRVTNVANHCFLETLLTHLSNSEVFDHKRRILNLQKRY